MLPEPLGPVPTAVLMHDDHEYDKTLRGWRQITTWQAHPITASRPAEGCVLVTQACGTCGTEIPLEVASVGITWRRRLVKLALCVVALLSGIATPFEAMALSQPERPLLVLSLVLVLFVHAMVFVYGLALIFSWGNHDGVRIPREDRFFRKGHPVLSAPDFRYRQRRSYGRRQ
jgi:hypothetical protein